MNWYQPLYFGKTAEKKKDLIIQRMEEENPPLRSYLITLAPTAENQLEIITPFYYRKQAERNGNQPLILGVGFGMEEAREVVCRIVEEIYKKTGTAEVRQYFERN